MPKNLGLSTYEQRAMHFVNTDKVVQLFGFTFSCAQQLMSALEERSAETEMETALISEEWKSYDS